MSHRIRLFSLGLAVCLLLTLFSAVSAEDCGIGDAVVLERDVNGVAVVTDAAGTLRQASTEEIHKSAEELENDSSVEGFVYRMYKVVLGREPDPTGFAFWIAQLKNGQKTASDIIVGFFNSPEYRNSGKNNGQIVTDCYNAMMNRDPDAGGKAHWTSYLDVGMTPNVVLRGFVGSEEFRDLASYYGIRPGTITLTYNRDKNYRRTWFVYRLYAKCLGREPDQDGLEHWCTKLMNNAEGTSVAAGFVFSEEYRKRHTDNATFVDMLYDTIMGRTADSAGLMHWKAKLDYASTREKVLNSMMYSVEFKAQCADAGINLGKPIYEPDNTPAWQYNVRIMQMANQDRAKVGANPLTLREDLWEDIAGVRARELQANWSHTRPNGTSCFTVFDEEGMEVWTAGENIAYGYGSPESVYTAWMNSPGHHANLMNPEFETIGTYYYKGNRQYWAQLFYTPMPW